MKVSGQLHAPTALPPKIKAPATHCIGGWVGHGACLDAVVKRQIPSPSRHSNPRSSSPQPSTVPLSYLGCLPMQVKHLKGLRILGVQSYSYSSFFPQKYLIFNSGISILIAKWMPHDIHAFLTSFLDIRLAASKA
jgi:hypothetical protein